MKKLKNKIFLISIFTFLMMISLVSASFTLDSTITLSGGSYTQLNGFTNEYNDYSLFVYYKTTSPVGTVITYRNSTDLSFINETYIGGTYNVGYMYDSYLYIATTSNTIVKKDPVTYSTLDTINIGSTIIDFVIVNDTIYKISTDNVVRSFNMSGSSIENKTVPFGTTGITFRNNTFYLMEQNGQDVLFYIYDEELNYLGDSYTVNTSLVTPDFREIDFIGEYLYVLDANSDKLLKISDIPVAPIVPYFYLDGEFYSYTSCVDENNLCTGSTSYVYNGVDDYYLICTNSSDITYCSDSCTNIDNGFYYEGNCQQLGCTNECNIIGQDQCLTQNTYGRCGQYDADACLEYGTPLFCPSEQYCYEDDLGAYCNVSSEEIEDLYTVQKLNVDIELINNTGELDSEGQQQVDALGSPDLVAQWIPFSPFINWVKTAIFKSKLDKIEVGYSSTTFIDTSGVSTDFYATNCEYEETFLFNEDFNTLPYPRISGDYDSWTNQTYNYILVNNNTNLSLTGVDNQVIETVIELEKNGTYYINVSDTSQVITSLKIVNDKNNYNILISEVKNNKLLVNSTSTSDDLQEIYLKFTYISNIDTLNLEVQLVREVLSVDVNEYVYSLPLSVNTDSNPSRIEFIGEDLRVYQYSVYTVNSYPIFKQDDEKNKLSTCEYNEVGCYNVRVYGNTQGIPTYHFSDDYIACLNELGGSFIEVPSIEDAKDQRSIIEKVLGKEWNSKEKLAFASLILFIMIILIVVSSYTLESNEIIVIESIITGLIMLYFTIEGFIPIWLIILFAIIGAMIGASLIRKNASGG